MNAKTLMTTALAGLLAIAAHAITSEEIAAALDVDPSIGTFSCSGVADWYVDIKDFNQGESCMRSGNIPGYSDWVWRSSALTLSVSLREASRISFWVKTSCYNSSSYASFNVSIDNATYTYRGENGWFEISHVLIPGEHTIRWDFQREYSYSSGSNCAWVDNVSFMPITGKSPTVAVTGIRCTQRTPWNGKVDIDYTVNCEKADADIWVYPVGYDKDSNTTMAPRALEGDGVNAPVKAGPHRMTWTVTDDYPDFNSTAFTVKMTALVGAAPYMVVDLSGGVDAICYPVSYLSSVPEGGWGDEYKTTKMVLRLVPSGCFYMGSPSDETNRSSYEEKHGVVLTQPFYIGVFECTQKQYQLVMGSNPVTSSSYKGDTRPVASISYNNLCGSVNGAGWPSHNQVDADSFMGRLRSKANMLFDLPTEAQWEYACRAGTSTALNSGKDYSVENLKEVARCNYNSGYSSNYPSDGKGGYAYATKVGSYKENAWGIYDMHGNVSELCRDYWLDSSLGYAGAIDPKGATSCYYYSNGRRCRAYRGGSYTGSTDCRSACRYWTYLEYATSTSSYVGFRVYCSPVAQ